MDELFGTLFLAFLLFVALWGWWRASIRAEKRDEWNRKYGNTDFENPYGN